jgi:hypothetical protein
LHSIEKAKEAIFYSYNKNINGFAAILDEDEATKIASMLCNYSSNNHALNPN